MVAESVGCGWWAIIAFVAHQAQPVVHCLQVVDHCPLILALLPTPGAVGYTTEAAKGIWAVYSHQSHDFWRLGMGYHMEEFEALG